MLQNPDHSLAQRALKAIDELQSRLDAVEHARREPIAIIGLGCRFPGGANDADSFWSLLRDGGDAVRDVPRDRWNVDDFFHPDPAAPGKIYTRRGAFLDGLDLFDAHFFRFSPREARSLDPQQRLLLEVTWEALENAGIAPLSLQNRPVGVFAGLASNDYAHLLARRDANEIDAYLATGNAHSMAAGRISYLLGFEGPSVAVDTACSSALTAVHFAIQSLRTGECDIALAGAANCILQPDSSINFCKARMLAPDGRCKTFDARADGFVRGEGAGMVVLKRLSDARRDGDRILALLRGSAMNQDGHTSGPTVPKGPAQQAVIRRALENAGLRPHEISYVETHGTGTSLGDPIEAMALDAAYRPGRDAGSPLVAGSVKTNIGHLEGAAGIAGLVKLVLSLQQRRIPGNLHFGEPSPHIPWDSLCLRVPTATEAWTSTSPRRAGISSFGFSGTNVHAIVEEAPVQQPTTVPAPGPYPLALSAKTEPGLRELAARYRKHLLATPDRFADIAYSAYHGRSHFEHRLMLQATDNREAAAKLSAFLSGEPAAELHTAFVPDGTEESAIGPPFVNGRSIEWNGTFNRVALPTYPFQRRRYWASEDVPDASGFTYEVAWEPRPQPASHYFSIDATESRPAPEGRQAMALDALAATYVNRALRSISTVAPRHRRLHEWLREHASAAATDTPAPSPELTLLTRCGEHLAGILSGERDAVATLFPPGDRTLEQIYEGRAANDLIRAAVCRAVSQTPADCRVRILEVGGGTGGSTAHLLPALDAARTEYVFTDLSPAFLTRACERFAAFPQVRFNLLDAEKDPEPQGFAPGSFDIIVAANVVHATADLRTTLRHLRKLLAPGGLILLLEVVRPQLWLDVTFGLLEGWWRFTDSDLRTVHPLLQSSEWLGVLRECGFAHTTATAPSSADGALSVELISAQAAAEDWQVLRPEEALPSEAPSRLLYLAQAAPGDPQAAAEQACLEVLALVKNVQQKQRPTALWVAVPGTVPACDAVPAALSGLGRVIGLEHPEIWSGLIHYTGLAHPDQLIAAIAANAGEKELSLANGEITAPRIVPKALPDSAEPRFPSDATYLITGGLGFLGRRLTEWMAARGARHFVVTSRSPEKHTALPQIADGRIEVVRVDAASPNDMVRLLERMPPLRGVVHAAGHGHALPIELIGAEELAAEFRPKIGGGWLLHELTRNQPLDFFICFSSASSVWGAKGQAHYAAANACLDALAHHRRAIGLPALSVNWGLVTGGGMISAEYRSWLTRIGVEPLEPEDGFRAMFQLAAAGAAQGVLARVDWKVFTEVYQARERSGLLDQLSVTPAAPLVSSGNGERFRSLPAGERRGALMECVQEEFCRTLGLSLTEAPDPRQGFFEAGMDSLLAIEFKNRLQTAFGVTLPSTLAFNYPNASAVAELLDAQLVPEADSPREMQAEMARLFGGIQHFLAKETV